ncbi:MAG TPA: hypothetical protein VFN67_16475 [Polyangiales bacterium]|nr:hypothetical protein [Polyangiales bacterium]
MTQPAHTQEASDSLLDENETSGVEIRHSFIRPKQSAPGADAVPSFLVRQGDEQFMLPRLLVWISIGLVGYGTLEAGSSTYHFMRDARVRPLAATHIRAEVHQLVEELARRQPRATGNLDPTQTSYAAATTTVTATSEAAHDATVANPPALAFVPYTHVPHIKANATLYECRLFSMFACEPVGRVVELLPGEVELPPAELTATQPAGSPARGQYAVMQLTDPRAAEAESLRVRDPLDARLLESSQSPALDGETHAETTTLL